MKKIFAILISLLFVASVFGVASIMGTVCTPTSVSSSTVRVGDQFTFSAGSSTTPTVTGTGAVVLVSGPTEGAGCQYYTTYRAITAGDITIDVEGSYCPSHVKILSKDLPFKFFAKLFGFGNKE